MLPRTNQRPERKMGQLCRGSKKGREGRKKGRKGRRRERREQQKSDYELGINYQSHTYL